ncbi:DUF1330 domain-containing protein [uncultured Caulobacter sp.]|uniref:DUF1330 domain-containing protein n=1 Tax=uncultured Caulobacter sp. TaxID=158749 RepID=UPI00262F4974|nr:DUF1330 domain-containing protein [uncultured Caulobacter sp.]
MLSGRGQRAPTNVAERQIHSPRSFLSTSAYAIFIRERTRNPNELQAYAEKAIPLLEIVDVTILAAYGRQDVLEGPTPEGVVIARFPTIEAGRAFYDSPAY